MADVPGKFYRATKVRTGVAPSSAGSIEGEVLPPVNPPGSSLNSVGLTMPSAFTVSNSPLTANGTIGVAGAGTVAQYIRGDGSLADFPESSGGGSSVSYYLNGSVDQGTIGGIAYKELSKVPILGAGTDFSINADGYIASFITDAGDPSLLEIPGGNWNFETYFSASSSGGTPTFYVELYKVSSGGTATLIASSSSSPELIAFGTNLNPYFSTLAVPTTTLALTDRLAVRYYVTHSGRTITLHTENNHLCQIVTTFTTGITALNGLTAQVQNFAVGTTGTDFNIASATATHTFNLPTASATNRGALSSADWSLFTQAYNDKINSAAVTGTTTKTLTLTQQDGGTITASWTDLNTDAVTSVFGRTGAVVAANGDYTTAQVTESGNLYYTEARVNANANVAANTAARHNAVTLGTANGLSLSTQVLSLGLASAGVTGALSGTDWSTFNAKQNALTLTTSGTSGAATLVGATLNIPQYQAALVNPVTGTGASGQVAFWNGTTSQTGSANLIFDSTNINLGIGVSTAASIDPTITSVVIRDAGSKVLDSKTGVLAFQTSDASFTGTYADAVTAEIYSISENASGSAFGIGFLTSTISSTNRAERWRITSIGILQSNGAQTIQTSTGNLTLATAAGNGNILLSPNGTGIVNVTSAATFSSSVTANSFIKSGGTSVEFLKADGSVDSTTYVTIARTITINGTSQDLSANRTFNVGTVTSVTASSPLASSGGSTPNITIQQASGSQSGFLSSTDWTTFNNKQNALTNPVTGTGTTNYLPKFTGSTTIGNSILQDSGTRLIQSTGDGFLISTGSSNVVGGGSFLALANSTQTRWILQQINSSFGLDYWSYNGSSWSTIMNLTSGGNLLLGNPLAADNGARLQVSGTSTFSGRLFVSHATSGNYGAVIYNTSTTGEGLVVRGGSTSSHSAFVVQPYDGSVSLLNILATGAATFSSSVTAAELYLSTSNGLIGNINSSAANGGYLTWQTSGTTIADIGTAQQVFGTGGNDTFGINGRGARALTFGTNNTERLRITSGGNVLIGNSTDNGQAIVQIGGSNNTKLSLKDGSSQNGMRWESVAGANAFYLFNGNFGTTGWGLYNITTAASPFWVTNGGNVLIGTTSDAGYRLEVSGVIRANGGQIIVNNVANNWLQSNQNGTSAQFQTWFASNGTTRRGYFGYPSGSSDNFTLMNEANGQMAFGTNSSTALILASTGAATFSSSVNVGGVSANTDFRIYRTVAPSVFFSISAPGGSPNTSILGVNGTDVMSLTSIGNVSIGSISDTGYRLFVNGNTYIRSAGNTSATFGLVVQDSSANNMFLIRNDGAATFSSSVTATSFFESSDASLKTLIEDNFQAEGIANVTAKLYIKNGKKELGYYAQDLQSVLPSSVNKGSDGLLNLSYREVHTAKIAYLEEEIRQLKKRYEIN